VWYAAAGSYQGTLTQFNFGPFLTTGGSLVQMLNWTNDGGDGVDDYAVFVFSTGEVLVYQGDDPGNAAAWALIGRFQIGEPLGPRAHAKVGGTEIILTRDGYVDLSVALRDGRYSEQSAYSSKIIRATKEAARDYGKFFGWEAVLYPGGQLFIVNVPTSTLSSIQHVRETSSGGWCEFNAMNARTFAVFDDRLYFGDPMGNVFLADEDDNDNGANILSTCIPAFNSLGSRGNRKQITAAAAVTDYQLPQGIALDALADFNTRTRSVVIEGTASTPGFWDVSDWNTTDWGQAGETLPTTQPFRNLSAIGYTLTVAFRVNQRAQNIRWYATNIVFRQAGIN